MFRFWFPMMKDGGPPERVAQALRAAAAAQGAGAEAVDVFFEGDGLGRAALGDDPRAALIPEEAWLDPDWLAARTVPRDHPSIRRPRRDMRFRSAPEILDAVEAAVGAALGGEAAALAPVFGEARARLAQGG